MKRTQFLSDAERLFVHGGKTLKEIAGLTGVSARTLGDWKREGDWEKKRKLAQASTLGAVDRIQDQILRVIEMMQGAEDPGRYADQIAKLVAASTRIERAGGDLATQAVAVLERFVVYVREKNLEKEHLTWLETQIIGFMREVMASK